MSHCLLASCQARGQHGTVAAARQRLTRWEDNFSRETHGGLIRHLLARLASRLSADQLAENDRGSLRDHPLSLGYGDGAR